MKVYPLHIGDTKLPYGQFYGGVGKQWAGWRGAWRFLTDKSHYIVVPIHAFLIDHPHAGPMLVDAAINRAMAHAHERYYRHPVWRLVTDADEYRLPREQELAVQLQRLGLRASDIGTVILTHLHEDHLGDLRSLPQASVVLSRDAYNARNLGIFLFRKWSPSFAGVAKNKTKLIDCSSGPFHGFDKSEDLLGDGSIVLLPTPGHSDGHSSVLVQMDGYRLLLAGDALYTLRHLAVDQVRSIMLSKKMQAQQIDSIRRIGQLRRALPQTVVVPTHDHTAYMSRYLAPLLADGRLSLDERVAISTYETRLFEADGRLRPSALPRYLPAAHGGVVGAVAEPGGVRS